MIYTWLLIALTLFDAVSTILLVQYGGGWEANPIMRWVMMRSILLFFGVKVGAVGAFIGLAHLRQKTRYIKWTFWAYLVIYLTAALAVNATAQPAKWNVGMATVYHKKFEGRQMANGKIFRHRDRVVACSRGAFGQRVEIRYGKNGHSIVTISDRGRLHKHQFDVSQQVAKDLGLYNPKHGRRIYWRYIR